MPDGIDESDLDAELAGLEDEWASEGVATADATATSDAAFEFDLPSQPNQRVNIAAPATAPKQGNAISTNSFV